MAKHIDMTVGGCKECPFRHHIYDTRPQRWACWYNDETWHSKPDIYADQGHMPDWCPLPDERESEDGSVPSKTDLCDTCDKPDLLEGPDVNADGLCAQWESADG